MIIIKLPFYKEANIYARFVAQKEVDYLFDIVFIIK
jgi:hypothetical protein